MESIVDTSGEWIQSRTGYQPNPRERESRKERERERERESAIERGGEGEIGGKEGEAERDRGERGGGG